MCMWIEFSVMSQFTKSSFHFLQKSKYMGCEDLGLTRESSILTAVKRNSKRWAIAPAPSLIVVARLCSESDIYPGYPLPKDREFGSVRPYLPVSDGLLAA